MYILTNTSPYYLTYYLIWLGKMKKNNNKIAIRTTHQEPSNNHWIFQGAWTQTEQFRFHFMKKTESAHSESNGKKLCYVCIGTHTFKIPSWIRLIWSFLFNFCSSHIDSCDWSLGQKYTHFNDFTIHWMFQLFGWDRNCAIAVIVTVLSCFNVLYISHS